MGRLPGLLSLDGGSAIAPERETTQPTFAAVTEWAAGLSPGYLAAALDRARELAQPPSLITRLEAAEYAALEDAERLEMHADLDRVAAHIDEIAAASARDDANRIRRERQAREQPVTATAGAADSGRPKGRSKNKKK